MKNKEWTFSHDHAADTSYWANESWQIYAPVKVTNPNFTDPEEAPLFKKLNINFFVQWNDTKGYGDFKQINYFPNIKSARKFIIFLKKTLSTKTQKLVIELQSKDGGYREIKLPKNTEIKIHQR